MAREQEDVTKGQEDVTKGQEQVELEEPMEVEEAGAVKSRDGGDPRASPPLWPPKPLPVGGEERLLLEKQVEVEVEEKKMRRIRMKSWGIPSVDTSTIFMSASAFITFLFSLSSLMCLRYSLQIDS